MRGRFRKLKSERNSGRAMRRAMLLSAATVAVLVAGCRQDMQVQPRYNPYDAAPFFDDDRSSRLPVPGTVARGELHLDSVLYTGKQDGKDAEQFPFAITRAGLQRGQERYNIYCSPCHDVTGSGRGMIVLRGFPQPPSFHIDRLRQAEPGHFFDVMTNGLGVMYSYASRVSPEDRWRIAAYIRALQLSEQAKISDVPAGEQKQLNAEPQQ
jgi:mono/diheme cytochrome c family protein